jgi:alkylhydroperoxidase/carboxymuconolactone decarboxylase family protein YurZ
LIRHGKESPMQSKLELRTRLAQVLVGSAALLALGNGLAMLADPFGWYEMVETVKATGPANAHFIRDIGLAYLLSATLLARCALSPAVHWRSGLFGAGWLALHGGLHIYEVSSGICSPDIFWKDAPGTLGIPLLAILGIALAVTDQRGLPTVLPPALLLKAADKATDGMSPHLADIAKAPGSLARKYRDFLTLSSHRHAASAEAVSFATIAAELAEDCGPCALIAARMALANGIPRETINAALAGNPPPGAGAQAFAFGRAVSLGLPEADALGEAIEQEHGRAVRTELAVAVATARAHPTIKRGLGFAKSCSAVKLQI